MTFSPAPNLATFGCCLNCRSEYGLSASNSRSLDCEASDTRRLRSPFNSKSCTPPSRRRVTESCSLIATWTLLSVSALRSEEWELTTHARPYQGRRLIRRRALALVLEHCRPLVQAHQHHHPTIQPILLASLSFHPASFQRP